MSDFTPHTPIPDDIFDRHFGAGLEDATDTVDPAEDPETDDIPLPEGDDADTPEEGDGSDLDPVEGDDDTGEDGDDGVDDPAEDEGKDGAAEPAAEDAPFDRKELDKITDPQAKAVAERAFKNFQRAFTQKTQELAEVRKEAESVASEAREWQEEYAAWLADIGTPEGGEHFLLGVAEKKPELFSETVLVSVALALRQKAAEAGEEDPFEAALLRAQELSEDGKARRVFDGERTIRMREHRENQQRSLSESRAQSERATAVERLLVDEAGKAGVKKAESLEVVRDSVDGYLRRAAAAKQKVTADALRQYVAGVAQKLAGERADAARAAEIKARKDAQERVRKQAQGAKKQRPVPAGTATPGTKAGGRAPASLRDHMDDFFG